MFAWEEQQNRWYCLAVALDRVLQDIVLEVFVHGSCIAVIGPLKLTDVREHHIAFP